MRVLLTLNSDKNWPNYNSQWSEEEIDRITTRHLPDGKVLSLIRSDGTYQDFWYNTVKSIEVIDSSVPVRRVCSNTLTSDPKE